VYHVMLNLFQQPGTDLKQVQVTYVGNNGGLLRIVISGRPAPMAFLLLGVTTMATESGRTADTATEELAINGGPKAKTTPAKAMYPGGLRLGTKRGAGARSPRTEIPLPVLRAREYPSKVNEFEKLFAKRIGARHCLAMTNCTVGLISALVAVGVGPGDEVIVSGYTFFASCAAIVAAKAIPVICEIDDSLTMDPADLEAKITPHTKAIIPVHMRGAPCDMDAIMAIAKKHN